MFFLMLSYPQLIYFRETARRKLPYFQIPLIISSLVDFKILSAAKLVSLINILMVVEHILILIPLIFHTNVWHNFLMLKIHSFIVFLFFLNFCIRSARCFSFSSLTLFNKKCPNGRDTIPS